MRVEGVVLLKPACQPHCPQPVAGLARIPAVGASGACGGIVPHQHLFWQLFHDRALVQPAQPDLPVFGKVAIVVRPPLVHTLPAKHDRRMTHGRIAKARTADLLVGEQAVLPIHKMRKPVGKFAITAKSHTGCGKVNVIFVVKMRRLAGQAVRVRCVVGVHTGHKGPTRGGQPRIESSHNAPVRQVERPKPVAEQMDRAPVLQHLAGVVCGAVVHHHNFKFRHGATRRGLLVEQALQGCTKGVGRIPCGQHHRNQRCGSG